MLTCVKDLESGTLTHPWQCPSLKWHSHRSCHGSSFHVGRFMMPKRPLLSSEPLRPPPAESNELPDLGDTEIDWFAGTSFEKAEIWGCKSSSGLPCPNRYQNSPGIFLCLYMCSNSIHDPDVSLSSYPKSYSCPATCQSPPQTKQSSLDGEFGFGRTDSSLSGWL